ncbi:hypothetical protein VNO77_34088 [Canavalia gladiata]|uniref:Uncharacterized protein n=1 Tax=Canavalia gladiata TaxID=3824 RepID=A0AAN9KDR4_CANGL
MQKKEEEVGTSLGEAPTTHLGGKHIHQATTAPRAIGDVYSFLAHDIELSQMAPWQNMEYLFSEVSTVKDLQDLRDEFSLDTPELLGCMISNTQLVYIFPTLLATPKAHQSLEELHCSQTKKTWCKSKSCSRECMQGGLNQENWNPNLCREHDRSRILIAHLELNPLEIGHD